MHYPEPNYKNKKAKVIERIILYFYFLNRVSVNRYLSRKIDMWMCSLRCINFIKSIWMVALYIHLNQYKLGDLRIPFLIVKIDYSISWIGYNVVTFVHVPRLQWVLLILIEDVVCWIHEIWVRRCPSVSCLLDIWRFLAIEPITTRWMTMIDEVATSTCSVQTPLSKIYSHFEEIHSRYWLLWWPLMSNNNCCGRPFSQNGRVVEHGSKIRSQRYYRCVKVSSREVFEWPGHRIINNWTELHSIIYGYSSEFHQNHFWYEGYHRWKLASNGFVTEISPRADHAVACHPPSG